VDPEQSSAETGHWTLNFLLLTASKRGELRRFW
jgi:hypothetical protein